MTCPAGPCPKCGRPNPYPTGLGRWACWWCTDHFLTPWEDGILDAWQDYPSDATEFYYRCPEGMLYSARVWERDGLWYTNRPVPPNVKSWLNTYRVGKPSGYFDQVKPEWVGRMFPMHSPMLDVLVP